MDLKTDLINIYLTDKYYAETELVRLSDDTLTSSMKHTCRLNKISEQFEIIAEINSKISLLNYYFGEEMSPDKLESNKTEEK